MTGAAGFIGSHLCERLVADGHTVVGVDGFIPYYPRAIKEDNIRKLAGSDRFEFKEADLRVADLSSLVHDADVVVHMAAMAGSASWDAFDDYVT
ncbi:MAG TPA: NAD-dependent epimerase/dehydratase family protein, partial [Thermomicrobiales bacterium]|nr:NAD-dependent epimerase/dehydratase family protein [Thermomicrobiales bacterium]